MLCVVPVSLPQETQQIPTEEVALHISLSNGQKIAVDILTSDQTEDVLDVRAHARLSASAAVQIFIILDWRKRSKEHIKELLQVCGGDRCVLAAKCFLIQIDWLRKQISLAFVYLFIYLLIKIIKC